MSWIDSPALWIFAAGAIAQGVLTWGLSRQNAKDIVENKKTAALDTSLAENEASKAVEKLESKHDRDFTALENKYDREFGRLWSEVDSLREWRAQAKEQFNHLERRRREMGPRDEET